MLKSALRHFPLVLVIIVSFAFVGFALAHESDDPAHTEAHVNAEAGTGGAPGAKPMKPLDLIRKAKEEKQNIQQNAMEDKKELRAETKIQMQNASSGAQKREVMKGAWDDRKDIAKTRMASSSDLRGKIKDIRGAIREHAGRVKERFALALRQFEKLMARVESRIEKLKADGVATASVEADLEAAKSANVAAKADVQAVADFVASVDETADRETVRTQIQTLTKEAQASIKAAHEALKTLVKNLSALAKENKPKVDTSASVEAEAQVETSSQ
ncbi:MAG: hypothetical protein WAZ27_01265 [Minisyncoccia bacterium]